MNADFFYTNAAGRLLLQGIQKTGAFRLGACYLHSGLSRGMIPSYIEKNGIDMSPYAGQHYRSFAEFFGRKQAALPFDADPNALISPCDGLFSLYPIADGLELPMKGSRYRITDLIPEPETAEGFRDGLCLIFRLRASDYHHFCCFDGLKPGPTHRIPGLLHSVQPIACQTVPVYRLNRRWWTLLETDHFGTAAQIEVGAMMVGGVTHVDTVGMLPRGAEFGNFELAGSTIVLLLNAEVRKSLRFDTAVQAAVDREEEYPVKLGQRIGTLNT